MNHGGTELPHEGSQTTDRRSALKEGEEFSPRRKGQRMSGNGEGLELIPEGAGPRADHMRFPLVAIEGL